MDSYSTRFSLAIFLIFLFGFTTVTKGFLLDDSRCVWYGQCGQGWNGGTLNCLATGQQQQAPLMTDPEGLKILKDYCPDIYKGDTATHTCCNIDQLRVLQQGLSLPLQLLKPCPACLKNFLNLVCQQTCSPDQAKFVWANMSQPYPDPSSHNNKGIPSITVLFSNEFVKGIFDSCKDLSNGDALSLFCGRQASLCTPSSLLNYLGNTGNGQAPFPIRYVIGDNPWTSPTGDDLVPLKAAIASCDQTVQHSSSIIGTSGCKCRDCAAQKPCPTPPPATPDSRKKYFDSVFGLGNYEVAELVIQRADSQKPIVHVNPPPSTTSTSFPAVFDKNFLKQVLSLQQQVSQLQTTVRGQTVSFSDVCATFGDSGVCTVESVLQMFQNNETNLDKEATDDSGFFVLADYIDHFLACKRDPGAAYDGTQLKMSCQTDFGNATWPYMVFQNNESELVISFVLKYIPGDDTMAAWESKFVSFMKSYHNDNMTITYKTSSASGSVSSTHKTPNADPGHRSTDEELDGHCIWYGQCGTGWNGGRLNCHATNKTRNAPYLTDPTTLNILKEICPDFYKGPNNTRTCCDPAQITTIYTSIDLPDQLLSRCPACYRNFLNEICYMTCSPVQSNFLTVDLNQKCQIPSDCNTSIPGVTYIMTNKYADTMYDSCKDVQMPSANDKAISLFCGVKAEECNPKKWLRYMGSTGNGRAPFPIGYIFTDDSYVWVPENITIKPLDLDNKRCNETVSNSNGTLVCKCRDCAAQKPCPARPAPPTSTPDSRKKYFDSVFGVGNYEVAELVIQRADSHKPIVHMNPPPSITSTSFPAVFDKNFLKQVLSLQQQVSQLQTTVRGQTVSFSDVCATFGDSGVCTVESVLQMFQNNETNLDKEAMDGSGFFVLADYLDHFLACKRVPGVAYDGTQLKMSCQTDFGNTTWPYMVFQNNESELVISFVLKYIPGDDKMAAWESKFISFMKSYHNDNMTITYKTSSASGTSGDVSQPAPVIVVRNLDVADGNTAGRNPGYTVVDETAEDDADPGYRSTDEELDGHCIWYGQCGTGWNGGRLNCHATNKTRNAPYLTDPTTLDILKKICPDFYKGPNNTRTCCDPAQITTIYTSIDLPDQLLSRCPACYRNFLNEICYMTCSPVQSNFLTVDLNQKCQIPSDCNTSIPGVTYIMTNKYADTMYDSCKDVQMPSANDKAISLFCGVKAEECNPKKWLHYMGSTGNGRAPFPIGYNFTDKSYVWENITINPLDLDNKRCNETVSNSTFPCSCQDCAASCAPVPPPPPPKKPCKIVTIDCAAFIASAVFIAFIISFGLYVICFNIMKKDSLGTGIKYSFDGIECETRDTLSAAGSQKNLLGYKQVSPADIGGCEKVGLKVERQLKKVFSAWGRLCAKHPLIVLLVSIIIFGSLAGGIARYDVTTDPVKLWSAKTSTARVQKDYFDSHFGPFYRTEQIIISRPNNHTNVSHPNPPPSIDYTNFSSLFDKDFMHQVLDLQTTISELQASYRGENVTLQDICFKPLAPDHQECTIMSVLQYYQNNATKLDQVAYDDSGFYVVADYLDHFLKCTQAPASVSDETMLKMACLGENGAPSFPWVVLGGYDETNYRNSTAFVITMVVNNHLEEEENGMAEAWEAEFIKFMKSYKNNNMTISFSSERSIQDELDRESKSDIWTIALSYIIMFGYITVALGTFNGLDTVLIDSKFTLGISGVTIVLLSVAASVGFYSFCNVPMTLIIIEVVPFLVLAVGVDNIFILVQTYQRDVRKPGEELEDQIGRILGQVGPSMLLTSFSESIAFFLGALTDMPAVREFALYAAMAVLFDFLLQITCFISLMTIDAKRQESNRFDMCCCLTLPKKEKDQANKGQGYLYWLVNEYYSHALMAGWIRPIVIIVFVGWFLASAAMTAHLEIGLDQSLSMPEDSYVLDYFKNLTAYLSVGAPVYFVVPAGYKYTTMKGQNGLCGGNGCPQDSLIAQVFHASQLPNYSYIAQPASSWVDDYFDWIKSEGTTPCCRLNATGAFCPSTSTQNCTACPFQPFINGRPTSHDFMHYLPMFLVDNPGLQCAKGGHAAYGAGVNLIKNKTDVGASYFMTYHTILKTSSDYINALKEARIIADNISLSLNLTEEDQKVFPYSIFYVFYEQYLFIVKDTLMNIGICMGAIFIATFLLLGFDFISAAIVCFTILMIIVDIMGMMFMWNIDLNALSLVNLVMAIGISVEFCSHIARAFAISIEANRVERARDALAHMGSSVLSGITLTKLGGIIVLAFAKSQLFQVFYFRMYLGMVVFGASHGLIFLPVLLSYIGPGINKAKLYEHQLENTRDVSKLNGAPVSPSATPRETYRRIDDNPPSYNHVS